MMESRLNPTEAALQFDSPALFEVLQKSSSDALDLIEFGVIGFDAGYLVCQYNATESRLAGLTRSSVMGLHFFEAVAPCMNNFMVAQVFEDAVERRITVDCTMDYVLTLRMRPQRVKLRLLADPDAQMRFVIIRRNT